MRRLAVLTAVLSLALGLIACGDSNDSASSEGEAGTTTAAGSPRPSEKPSKENERRGGGGDRAEDAPRPSAERTTGDKFTSADGSGKIHGDGSIERYGEDGSEDDFDDAAAAASDFYAAMIVKDWPAVCEVMAPRLRDSVQKLVEAQPALKGKGCPEILDRMMGFRTRAQLRQMFDPRTRFTGLRVKDDQAFLLLTSPEIKAGTIPMVRDGDGWKVGALNASPL